MSPRPYKHPVQGSGLRPPGPARRRWTGAALILGVLAGILFVGFIPWRFPSSSMLYRFGGEKTIMLAGKSLAMAAGLLLLAQVLLVARVRLLERFVAQNRLISLHRFSGTLLVALAILHPLLVFAPEDLKSIPPGLRYWPEIIGAILLMALLTTSVLTIGRDYLAIPHQVWKPVHRWTALMVGAAYVIHVFYVNDGYAAGLPRYVIAAEAAVFGAVWLWIAIRPLRRNHLHRVLAVAPAGKDALSLELAPVDDRLIRHWPGQFAYLRLRHTVLSSEEHPFTIASQPGRSAGPAFTIRCAGDWTSRLSRLRPGDMVSVDGPYGAFTPAAHGDADRLVMIAGGVGITPMLSILRAMVEEHDQRALNLIWSTRTPEDVVHADEFQELRNKLPGLEITLIHTRAQGEDRAAGRLDRERLAQILGPCRPGALILLCGPGPFMRQIRKDLKAMGYSGGRIIHEAFRM